MGWNLQKPVKYVPFLFKEVLYKDFPSHFYTHGTLGEEVIPKEHNMLALPESNWNDPFYRYLLNTFLYETNVVNNLRLSYHVQILHKWYIWKEQEDKRYYSMILLYVQLHVHMLRESSSQTVHSNCTILHKRRYKVMMSTGYPLTSRIRHPITSEPRMHAPQT